MYMKRILVSLLSLLTAVSFAAAQSSVYDFTVKDANGADVSLSAYRGKVLLVVNTATKCGFTPQYKELQAAYEKYKDLGFEILDFPCNQFGEQAPGTNAEIAEFCTENYHTTFPQFLKIDVNGENASPFWRYLYAQKGFEGFGKGMSAGMMDSMMKRRDKDYASKPEIKWNFTKFLVDRQGKVVARFEPTADEKEWDVAIKSIL